MSDGKAPARSPQDVALARLRRKLEREAQAEAATRALENAPRQSDGTLALPRKPHADAPRDDARQRRPAAPAQGAAAAGASSSAAATPARAAAAAVALVEPGAAVPRATTWRARFDAYERLVRLDKPVGWLLLLWPTLTALWISSWGRPTVADIIVFFIGTILMRSAGCALNDWADRDFDGEVKRTAQRPLVTGEIAPREALYVAAALALAAFVLVCFTNWTTILLSLPALAIAIAYPFVKRVFAIPQAFLGIAFSFGIPMAFAAEMGRAPMLAWIMLGINLFWVLAYDTEYAMVDRDDDVRTGIHTSAITFGRYDVLIVALCYVAYLGGMAWVGWLRRLGVIYFGGIGLAAALAAWHVWMIRTREREACFRAFRSNAWLGGIVFAGTALALVVRFGAWPTLR